MKRLLLAWMTGAVMLVYGWKKTGLPVPFGDAGSTVDFLKSIHAYGVLPTQPPWILNLTAVGLPWLEVICGLALILGPFRRGAAALSFLSLAAFTTAITLRSFEVMAEDGVGFFALSFDCGCGSGEVIIWQKLLFNLALILATACLIRRPRST